MGMELRDERKVVTVLFADLVGSTVLGERLDPEDLRLLVGDAVARIVAEVERLGGRVKDLAGDGVLAFFGAPVTSEDDPERAIRAGIRIAEELVAYAEEVRRSFGQEGFGVRVGIGTGPVVLGELTAGTRVEYAAFGDTVNTAARLQASARTGAVLVDAETRRLAGPACLWSEPAELELKGKAGSVLAYEVRGLRTEHGRAREAADFDIRLVGRDAELAATVSLVDGLHSGVGGMLFITGEPGIGKSRLLAELRDRFDARWLEGRCVSYGESLPYWPFRELLRDWLGLTAGEPELRARIALRRNLEQLYGEQAAKRYPYLGSLLGLALDAESGARLAELSPEALQYRTFEVMIELVDRLAADGPLALAIEDLHWADATSVQLAERLLGLTETAALLLAVTERSERDLPSWRLKELAAHEYPHLMREFALEPLSREAERELLHTLAGPGTLPTELERRLLEVAEGNPFFLQELVRSLADAGALVREGRGWRFDHEARVEVPQTVEKVVLARLDRLNPECRRVVTAASALGRRFGLALLEGVLGDGEVSGVLHELQRADLVRAERRWPQPQYRFKHVLIQEVAYRTLVSATRTGLHRRAAEWLENPRQTIWAMRSVCSHTTGSRRVTKTARSTIWCAQATGRARSTRWTRRSGTTASCCRCSNGAAPSRRWRLSCSSWRSRCTPRSVSPTPTPPTGRRSLYGARLRPCPQRRRCRSRRTSCPTTPTRTQRSPGPISSSACSSSTGWSRRGRSGRSCPRSPSDGRSRPMGFVTCSTCTPDCAGRTVTR